MSNRSDYYLESVGDQLAQAAGGKIKRPDKSADDDETTDRILAGIEKYLDEQPTQAVVATTRDESIVNNAQKNVVEQSDREKFQLLISRLRAHEIIDNSQPQVM